MTSSERWPAILLQLDSDDWVRATDLAEAMGVSESTVYRDVHAMVEAGISIRGVPGHGYQLPEGYVLSPIRLTTDEAAMLVVGSTYAAQQYDGRYRAAARTARERIDRVLPTDAEVEVESLQGSVPLARPAIFGESVRTESLAALRKALATEHTVIVTVSENGRSSVRRTIDPYGLVRRGTTWSVIGHDHERDRVVQVQVQTIEDLSVTDDTFQRPQGYGSPVPTVEGTSLARIRVAFSPEVASSVEVPPSLDVVDREPTADGRLRITLHGGEESEVMPWILSWGRHAQVLEPRSLRERVGAEIRAAADQYDSAPTLLD